MSKQNAAGSMHWHTKYDVSQPPPKPHPRYVRFIVISDTHSTRPNVPQGDVLLHSGDLTDIGGTEAFREHLAWLGSLPHPCKIIIAGNHDFGLCNKDGWYEGRGKELHDRYGMPRADTAEVRTLVQEWERGAPQDGMHAYVEDRQIKFDAGGRTWSLYGSPWSPEFGGWAWNYKRGQEAKELHDQFEQCDILLTHSPPHQLGRLDVLTDGKTHVGCEELTNRMENGTLRPLLHCFGHIHEAYGAHLQRWDHKADGHTETLLLNSALVEMNKGTQLLEAGAKLPFITMLRWLGLSRPSWLQLNLKYSVVNLPIIVDIDPAALKELS